MAIQQLITEQEVKDITSLSNNAEASRFRHYIQVAQDIHIKPAISETCYNSLLDSVEASDPTALETVLLDGDGRSFSGIKVALAWWVLYLAYPDLATSITNSGVVKKTGENFEPISISELNMKRKTAETTAVYYTKYLVEYIQKNSTDYPCYVCDGITPLVDSDDVNGAGIALDYDKITRVSESQSILNTESNG